tara:strand:- start:2128 stop:3087 length:960 start_codon:yes stop_codon:yes gene_type:complete
MSKMDREELESMKKRVQSSTVEELVEFYRSESRSEERKAELTEMKENGMSKMDREELERLKKQVPSTYLEGPEVSKLIERKRKMTVELKGKKRLAELGGRATAPSMEEIDCFREDRELLVWVVNRGMEVFGFAVEIEQDGHSLEDYNLSPKQVSGWYEATRWAFGYLIPRDRWELLEKAHSRIDESFEFLVSCQDEIRENKRFPVPNEPFFPSIHKPLKRLRIEELKPNILRVRDSKPLLKDIDPCLRRQYRMDVEEEIRSLIDKIVEMSKALNVLDNRMHDLMPLSEALSDVFPKKAKKQLLDKLYPNGVPQDFEKSL